MNIAALENITTRRSIRKYKTQPVEKRKIDTLLKAAMAAPSAGNQQPWDFIVVTEEQTIARVRQASRHAWPLEGAPLCVLVCGNVRKEKYRGHWMLDCSAATQNLLLAAHGVGLGAVWNGIYPGRDRIRHVRRIFGLPKYVIPFAAVSVGYPAEENRPEDRFSRENIHWEKW